MRFIIILLVFVSVFTYGDKISAPLFGSASSYVDYVIARINEGDRDIMRTISYRDINFVLDYKRSRDSGGYKFFFRRGKVANSALKGLFNTDPRVRLICVEILFLLKPDRLMEPEVSLAYRGQAGVISRGIGGISGIEGGRYTDYYRYVSLSGERRTESVSELLGRLYSFVLRDKFLYIMLKEDSQFLRKVSKEDFLILRDRIHEESEDSIPLRSYGDKKFISASNLRVIIYGLENRSLDVRQGCADYLIGYYNHNARYLNLYYRNLILKALKGAYIDGVIKKPDLVKFGG